MNANNSNLSCQGWIALCQYVIKRFTGNWSNIKILTRFRFDSLNYIDKDVSICQSQSKDAKNTFKLAMFKCQYQLCQKGYISMCQNVSKRIYANVSKIILKKMF